MPIPNLVPDGIQYVRDHLATLPRPDRAAGVELDQWLKGKGIEYPADQLDVVTLHYQLGADHGWTGIVAHELSLTEALLSNYQASSNNAIPHLLEEQQPMGSERIIRLVDSLRRPEQPGEINYYVFNGIFRRTQPQTYEYATYIPVAFEDLQDFVWNLDFHTRYTASLQSFWNEQLDPYSQCLKLNFIAACNKQAAEGSLSEQAVKLAWQAAGLETSTTAVQARILNVYGYPATDLVCFKRTGERRILLYIPGNASPLHEFASHGELQDWIAVQCQDPARRQALQAHFNQADTPDGLSFSGLSTALEGLGVYPKVLHLDSNRPGFTTDGTWSPRDYVNYKGRTYSPRLEGPLFAALAERYQQRSYHDADFLIRSDSEVSKARWRGYLDSTLTYLAPLALAVPQLWPLFAVGGIAQFGLGLDQAIKGKSLQEQAEGVSAAEFGLLNALPLVQELASDKSLLFAFKRDRFVRPSRINEQWGYPLSPIDPPRLPAEDASEFFRASDSVAPLAEADANVAGAVIRVPNYDGSPDTLQASLGGYPISVLYDVEQDAFISSNDLNEVEPSYYIAPARGHDLVRVDPRTRPVSDAMRMRSMRALGVDLQLPIDLPLPAADTLQPIPRQILSVWVGNDPIPAELLSNIARNATRVERSGWEFRLYLSNADSAAFSANQLQLAELAPSLRVLPLEQQPFFDSFRASPSYRQYQAALDGNGGVARNYASAADVLRYPLLNQEGGLYMDVDDRLFAPGEHPADQQAPGAEAVEPLNQLELATTDDGLLLSSPMSNEKMAMDCQYNNSFIGSRAGNPTLEAISTEMNQRFLARPDFYDSRPSLQEDRRGFYRYASTLSQMTGPGLLTTVVDRQLPVMATLRNVNNLYGTRPQNFWSLLDMDHYRSAVYRYLPLDRIAETGGFNSWAQ
ncbi:dermonecrotic toxin domain-containing protein [Pseudomonas shirazensis]|uniref:dermonecrotic toxin domain-containing protein n=1 Tax=Pseudomonas shirazensis TaxID=2745494 RepID=UPI003D2E1F57